ncbi:MAG: hypothetical protein AB7S38_32750 [Vulcanimicrobiota bacterium]
MTLGISERQVVEARGLPSERMSLGVEVILYYEPCPTVIIDSGRRVEKVLGGDSLKLVNGETLKADATLTGLVASFGPPAGRLLEDETWYYPGLRVRVGFSKRGCRYCLGEGPSRPAAAGGHPSRSLDPQHPPPRERRSSGHGSGI